MKTNIKTILDRLLRHPLLSDLTIETVTDYTIDFIRLISGNKSYSQKNIKINIHNHMGELPRDFMSVDYVLYKDIPMIGMTSRGIDNREYTTPSYKLQSSKIITSVKEGEVDLYYNSVEMDNEGFLIIDDDSLFLRALEAFIKKEYFTILFDLGKINSSSLSNAQQDYGFRVGRLQAKEITVDEMESFARRFTSPLDLDWHSKNFR